MSVGLRWRARPLKNWWAPLPAIGWGREEDDVWWRRRVEYKEVGPIFQ